MDDKKELFESMPIYKALAKLAVPTIISQLIVMIYNLADTFFIGKTNDQYKIAAVSLAYVLFFMLNALANLFGIGGGSLISRLLGEDKKKDASSVSALCFYGTIVVTVLYCVLLLVFNEPVLRFIGASDATLKYASEYTLWVVIIGGLPATLSMMMSHLLRSDGYGSYAGTGLSMGSVLNIIFDPIFMFVLLKGHEVAGAAIATMLANVIALVYYLYIYYKLKDETVLTIHLSKVRYGLHYIQEVIYVGFPSAIASFLVCVSIMLTNSLASHYGDIPIAAIGIVKKLEMLPHNVGTGLCQGMIPLVGYNFASKNYKRMKQTINLTRIIGIIFTLICIVLFELFARELTLCFIKEPETVKMTVIFLKIMVLATPLTVLNFHMSYTLQAMGKGKESLLLSISRQGIILIPLLFILNGIFGLYGIIWAQFTGDLITVIISFILYSIVMKQIEKTL